MQVTINRMSKSRTAHYAGKVLTTAGLFLLSVASIAQAPSSSPAPKPASGPGTATDSSVVATAQQNLYTASGQNGAQPTQDSFKGSVVTGKATAGVMDLSLDDAVQRGLRQNLGLILQTSSV